MTASTYNKILFVGKYAFLGIIIIAYDPRFIDQLIGLLFVILMAFFYAIANNLKIREIVLE